MHVFCGEFQLVVTLGEHLVKLGGSGSELARYCSRGGEDVVVEEECVLL